MLTLTRRHGESIILFLEDNQEIVITLARGNGGSQHKIEISAPDSVTILREELLLSEQDD